MYFMTLPVLLSIAMVWKYHTVNSLLLEIWIAFYIF